MSEAYDHKRVTPVGRAIGDQLARLTDAKVAEMVAAGEPDERCKTCAFRAGTVPNGCPQTLMDAVKCVIEQQPFYCHVNKYADGRERMCAGWLAATGERATGRPARCRGTSRRPTNPHHSPVVLPIYHLEVVRDE